ncbi:hypothetical protein CLV62_104107 [Dysgonomonas alginatilytica]|uniref:Copper chaperone CopZ n=1 Tax=Dysgonomonas alginatilytica TaxID=1605892 RepID=A0A2V3PRM4_9BACT|nr:hypothetical protein [Dysgonomonas alginatilytica]PXV66846.1 hypothetical protein CLV62_104107 [Dysgonomonas alginatilytica]
MKTEDFNKAVQILTTNNQIKVSFNTPITDNYSSVYKILIHESNAAVINELIKNGYSLSMCPKGLSVKKY